ncbi:MAG: response regulator [Phycisphaerales bacterium]|nr:response regulator [Phycisphaerales bacterium]
MPHPEFVATMNLSDGQRQALLDRADAAKPGPSGAASPRAGLPFRAKDLRIVVTQPGGGVSRFLVHARHLGSQSITVLHGGFLYPGSRVQIAIPRKDGGCEDVPGRIAWAEPAEGRLHFVGIDLDAPIDVREFIRFSQVRRTDPAAEQLPTLSGCVLHVDDLKLERDLLKFHLRQTRIDLLGAESHAQAVAAVRAHPVEVVLCDFHLADGTGDALIGALRAAGFTGPIALLTAETDSAQVARARNAGADRVIAKPYEHGQLLDALADLLQAAQRRAPKAA